MSGARTGPGATSSAVAVARERLRPVAYLTKRFPRLSETFILDEILGLEEAGVPLRLFAIRDPHESLVQPDVARVRASVAYLRSEPGLRAKFAWLGATAAAHARLAAAHPVRYARTLLAAMTRSHRRAALGHFVDAGRLAGLLDAAGVGHLHAAFAHGPAAIAHQVHLLTGRPFSFAAHAKDLYVSDPRQLARRAADAEFVLVCSRSARDALSAVAGSGAARVRLAYHGVDTRRFRPAAGTVPTDEAGQAAARPLRILAAGRLVEKKGFPVLLDAIGLLAARGRVVACRVVGDGPLHDALEARAAELGIAGLVTFDGERSHQAIADAYRESDVFVQCSVVVAGGDRDGVPNVVLEAMASGLPVVASAVAGIPEAVVDGTTGFLVPASDPVAVADRLAALADDPALALRLGEAGRARVLAGFDRAAAVGGVARLLLGTAPIDAPRVLQPAGSGADGADAAR